MFLRVGAAGPLGLLGSPLPVAPPTTLSSRLTQIIDVIHGLDKEKTLG